MVMLRWWSYLPSSRLLHLPIHRVSYITCNVGWYCIVKVTAFAAPPSNGISAVTNGILLPLKGGTGTAGIGSIHVTVKSPHVIMVAVCLLLRCYPSMSCLFLDLLLLLRMPGVVITLPPPVTFTIYSIITAVWAAFQYHVCIYYYLTVVAQWNVHKVVACQCCCCKWVFLYCDVEWTCCHVACNVCQLEWVGCCSIANSAPDGKPAVCITGAIVEPAWYTTAPLNTLGVNTAAVHGELLVAPAFNVMFASE